MAKLNSALARLFERYAPDHRRSQPVTTAEETTIELIFPSFPRLPAELRAKIWAIALSDQMILVEDDIGAKDAVNIHQEGSQITVKSLRGYPTLFFVNREARYEAAKVDGGTWYPLGVDTVEVYANFEKEDVAVRSCYRGPKSNDSILHQEGIDIQCFVGHNGVPSGRDRILAMMANMTNTYSATRG